MGKKIFLRVKVPCLVYTNKNKQFIGDNSIHRTRTEQILFEAKIPENRNSLATLKLRYIGQIKHLPGFAEYFIHIAINVFELKTKKLLRKQLVSILEILDKNDKLTETMEEIKKRFRKGGDAPEDDDEEEPQVNIWLEGVKNSVYSEKMDILDFEVCFNLVHEFEESFRDFKMQVRLTDLMNQKNWRIVILNPLRREFDTPTSGAL